VGVCRRGVYLEAVGMLVAGPDTGLGVEKKTFLVFLGDVVVHVLRDGELTVELYLVSRHKLLPNALTHTCSSEIP